MLENPIKVLIVESDKGDCALTPDLFSEIEENRFDISWATFDSAPELIKRNHYDVCFVGCGQTEAAAGVDFLRAARLNDCRIPMILCAGKCSAETVKEALAQGALDFISTEETNALLLSRAIRHALEKAELRAALKTSEGRYRELAENANDIIYTHDLSGNFTSLNRAGEVITGYSSNEAVRMNIEEIVAPEDMSLALQMFHRKLSGEAPTVYELKVVTKDGHRVTLEISTRLIHDDEGKAIGVQGIARDITHRKQAEEALRHSQEQLQQSQRLEAIGQLAGGVAHDFNNLLTVISGYSDLALRRLAEDDPVRHNIKEIMRAASRAASLTRQLLAFSRKQVLQPTVLDLNAIVAEIEKLLHRLIGENIELRAHLEPTLGRIMADSGQIEQMVINLAVNARDALPAGGGKITIATTSVRLDETYAARHVGVRPGAYAMLSVSDNGCGIDVETQQRVFEPFFTTKEQGKGTGLGLSTVYGIVKQSGGNVWLYSEVGVGTTFKVYLPLAERELEQAPPDDIKTTSPRGWETVLLVEDDELVRQMTKEVLEAAGYNVLETNRAMEALRISEEHRGAIHLLLTDVVMPELSGQELAVALASGRPEMRVLYMSGYTDEAVVHHGVLDKGVNFLQKPFTPDALARRLRQVLDAEKRATAFSSDVDEIDW